MASLIALPLAAGAAQAVGAGLGAAGAFAEANAMMPEAYQRQLAELEALEARGALGLSEADRARMEAAGVAQRAGQMAQAQARQMQAGSMASGSALSGRDLFQQELAVQDQMARQLDAESRRIREAQERAVRAQEQQMLELQMQQASADAAKRQTKLNLLGDIVKTGAMVGIGMAGAKQFAAGSEALASARAGTQAATDARMQAMTGMMAMNMAGAFGPMQMPAAPVAAPAPAPAAAPAPVAAPAQSIPLVMPPQQPPTAAGSPRILGFQQLPDGRLVPVYQQGPGSF